MDCPQCGAEVPKDDAFCGKCGYAMRDRVPERLDQSRIRVHEEPDPMREPPSRPSSRQRIRKHTVLGMPSLPTPDGAPSTPDARKAPAEAERPSPPPPRRSPGRTPQKTMLGMPQLESPSTPDTASPDEPDDPRELQEPDEPEERESGAAPIASSGPPPQSQSHRARARVRYDSSNEPLSITQRRLKALRVLGVMVLLAAAWLGYRFLTVNG